MIDFINFSIFHNTSLLLNNIFDDNKKIERLYYYTDTNVLNLVLDSATLWASNILYMNDMDEYKSGLKAIRKLLENCDKLYKSKRWYDKVKKSLDEIIANCYSSADGIFNLSFSRNEDSLHQWITYAKESGVCIELDGKELFDENKWCLKICAENDGKGSDYNHTFLDTAKNWIRPVKYTSTNLSGNKVFLEGKDDDFLKKLVCQLEKLEEIERVGIEKDVNDSSSLAVTEMLFQLVAAFVKHGSFKIEEEMRAIFFASHSNVGNTTAIKYDRKSSGVLRPHMEIAFCYKDEKSICPKLPLRGVVIGPSGLQQSIFDSVVHRLRYGNINVYAYNERVLNLNFCRYAIEAILRWCESQHIERISESMFEEISNKLYMQWRKEVKTFTNNRSKTTWYDEVIKEENDFSIFDFLKNNCTNDESSALKSLITKHIFRESFESPVCGDNILIAINKDNYFSKDGIWVRKSKIPYIYT